ncbi:MAG: (2Fe-2S)-binding protein [Myxococcales bacterium]|nr:(2Fe-2S)-binding protein [Myxococcales bacterium]
MVICHCHGISDHAIRKAIRGGASSRREIARSCKAGGACEGCAPAIDEILESQEAAENATSLPAFAGLVASTG